MKVPRCCRDLIEIMPDLRAKHKVVSVAEFLKAVTTLHAARPVEVAGFKLPFVKTDKDVAVLLNADLVTDALRLGAV